LACLFEGEKHDAPDVPIRPQAPQGCCNTPARAVATATLGPLIITERTIAQTRTVYVNTWGGSYTAAQDAAFFKPFTAATGIQVRTVTPVSYGKIKAQVQTKAYEFDMTSVNSTQWMRAEREGLAEPIDWTVVKRDMLPPKLGRGQ